MGGDYESPDTFSQSNILITKDGGKTWNPVWNDLLNSLCLFCATWKDDQSIALVEGSSRTFHSAVYSHDALWMAGPGKISKTVLSK